MVILLFTFAFFEIYKVEVLENHHVESQEKFQFLESDIIQLRTALKIQLEQSQLFERKLNNASSQNEAVNRENKILREGMFNLLYLRIYL